MPDLETLPFLNFVGLQKMVAALGLPSIPSDIRAAAEAFGTTGKGHGFVYTLDAVDAALAQTKLRSSDKIAFKSALAGAGLML